MSHSHNLTWSVRQGISQQGIRVTSGMSSLTISRLLIVCKTSRNSWKHCYFERSLFDYMDHDNCPLTLFKALLNIIGGKGAISKINYYHYYYYYYLVIQIKPPFNHRPATGLPLVPGQKRVDVSIFTVSSRDSGKPMADIWLTITTILPWVCHVSTTMRG